MSSYSAVSAKMRAMYGKGLKPSDFDNLLSKTTVNEVCGYLKNETSYSDVFSDVLENDVHRGVIEQRLWLKLGTEYKRLYSFVDSAQKNILEFRFSRREVNYLKHYIRNLFNRESELNHIPDKEDFSEFFKKRTKIDTELCRNAQSLDDFIKACENAVYSDFLKRAKAINSDFFSIAMGLDSLYYSSYWKSCEKLPVAERQAIERLIGSEIDMLNIIWIYRSKVFFKFDDSLIFTNLLPIRYKLSEEIIKRMVNAKNADDIIAIVGETAYKSLFKNIKKGFFVDENYRRILYKIAKSTFAHSSDTIAGVVAYLDMKELEILNVIRVIEGIRYSISPEALSKHIRL